MTNVIYLTIVSNLVGYYDKREKGAESMDLREFLFRKKMHLTELAIKVNYSRQHLSGVMHGKIKPGKKLIEAIEKATNGEVKAEDLLQACILS